MCEDFKSINDCSLLNLEHQVGCLSLIYALASNADKNLDVFHDSLVNFTCIRTSASNSLLWKTPNFDYIMSENKIEICWKLIYHDLHVYDTIKILKRMKKHT